MPLYQFSMTLQPEILSTESLDFPKQFFSSNLILCLLAHKESLHCIIKFSSMSVLHEHMSTLNNVFTIITPNTVKLQWLEP